MSQVLERIVQETTQKGLLKFTADIKDLADAEIIFICVGTPALPTGRRIYLRFMLLF